MKKYRTSKNKEEIQKYFSQRLTEKALLSTWQKLPNGERLFIPKLKLIDFFPQYGYFVIEGEVDDLKKIKSDSTSYFLFDDQDCVFKSKLEGSGKNSLSFKVPLEVKAVEKRFFERNQYLLSDKKFTDVVFHLKFSGERINLSSPVINLSRGGTSLLVTKEVFNIIDLTKVVQIRYKAKLKDAAVRNFRIYEKKSMSHDEYFAIGFQYLESLEEL
jgi:hypothetical protein